MEPSSATNGGTMKDLADKLRDIEVVGKMHQLLDEMEQRKKAGGEKQSVSSSDRENVEMMKRLVNHLDARKKSRDDKLPISSSGELTHPVGLDKDGHWKAIHEPDVAITLQYKHKLMEHPKEAEQMYREGKKPKLRSRDPSPKLPMKPNWKFAVWKKPAENKIDLVCFICHQGGTERSELIQCHKVNKDGSFCRTRFHLDCFLIYNPGNTCSSTLASLHNGKLQCHLHHCEECYRKKHKYSARLGDLVECRLCYRSWHKWCLPAGVQVEEQQVNSHNHVAYTVCQSHRPEEFEFLQAGNKSHWDNCCECDKPAVDKCNHCVRRFHKECIGDYGTFLKQGREEGKICPSCVRGDSIMDHTIVLCRHRNGFYPAVVIPLPEYQSKEAKYKSGKYMKNCGVPGFVAVKWIGMSLYSILPTCDMFQVREENIPPDWIKECPPARESKILGHHYIAYTTVKTSIYHDNCVKPYIPAVSTSTVMCDCLIDSVDRCSTIDCINREKSQECPLSCGCTNSKIAKKNFHNSVVLSCLDDHLFILKASAAIKKGTLIGEYAGEICNNDEIEYREAKKIRDDNLEERRYIVVLDKNRIVDAQHYGNLARYLEQSDEPNCAIKKWKVPLKTKDLVTARFDLRLMVETIKDIQEGEQLTVNF